MRPIATDVAWHGLFTVCDFLHSVPKKLSQKLTDFNDFWFVKF